MNQAEAQWHANQIPTNVPRSQGRKMSNDTAQNTEFDKLKQLLEDNHWFELAHDCCKPDFTTIESFVNGESRWVSHHSVVVQGESGNYYMFDYQKGLTELQEEETMTHPDSLVQVEPYEETIVVTKYRMI